MDPLFLVFGERLSDSPFVERVWHCHSERAGSFLSVAASHIEIVVTRHRGKVFATLRGPETKATTADCPADGEWVGIRFKLGTFLTQVSAERLIDRQDMTLPGATRRSFLLHGTTWEYPSFDNAETFVARLVKAGVIARDASVEAALLGQPQALSMRSAQRHFLQATGMTYGTFRQIERARHATNLLRQGVSILDTVHEAGYFDQPHPTRIVERRTLEEVDFHHIAERADRDDVSLTRPDRGVPFPFFDEIRGRIANQLAQPRERLAAPVAELVDMAANSF